MSPVAITREQKIVESVQRFAKDVLFNQRGYSTDDVEFLDGFPYERFSAPLTKEYIAVVFQMDDGGEQAELGSDFKRRVHTIEFYVFATTGVWGRNLASALRNALESAQLLIPLLDIGQPEPAPQIDILLVNERSPRVRPVIVRDPRPWEQNVWLCTLLVTDEYYSSSVS